MTLQEHTRRRTGNGLKVLALFALLALGSPAWADFAVGTPTTLQRTSDPCTTNCNIGNFTISGTGTLMIQAMVRGWTSDTDVANMTLTVGGVTATRIAITGGTSGHKAIHFEILPANLPAPGSQAVVTSTTTQIDSTILTLYQVTGLAGTTAEASAISGSTTNNTTATAITTVSANAFVAVTQSWGADPGTVTLGSGQTSLNAANNKHGPADGRWQHASYKTGPATPGSTGIGTTTSNSLEVFGARVAYAIAPAASGPRPLLW